jgi:hypothetical protein
MTSNSLKRKIIALACIYLNICFANFSGYMIFDNIVWNYFHSTPFFSALLKLFQESGFYILFGTMILALIFLMFPLALIQIFINPELKIIMPENNINSKLEFLLPLVLFVLVYLIYRFRIPISDYGEIQKSWRQHLLVFLYSFGISYIVNTAGGL